MQTATVEDIRQLFLRYHHRHQVAKCAGASFHFVLK